MTSKDRNHTALPTIGEKSNFDKNSGKLLERVVFNNRPLILLICFVISIFLGYEALQLKTNAAFDRMIPRNHPYIKNYFENKLSLSGLGNSLSIVVENTQGDIYDPEYVDALRQINDTVMLLPGIDRSWMKSLWMPIVRYTEVTEEGYKGGPVMPDGFDGSSHQTNVLRDNVRKAGLVGTLVATNQRSSMIVAPMLDAIGDTGLPVDYVELSRSLEKNVLSKQTQKIKVHIVGFPKLVGDLIDGLGSVIGYFGISALIATVFIYLYTGCLRSTGLLVSISLLSVVWLLGLMRLAGFELDPYSILAPFLIFCIGLSHGAQRMNGIMQDVGRGADKYVAARYTFRRLFMAGLTALLTNVVGFGVLMIIDIPVIQALAIQTSMGVSILIFTKLILIPVGLSYTGVSVDAARRSLKRDSGEHHVLTWGGAWQLLGHLTHKRWALPIVAFSLVAAGMGYMVSLNLKIGDLGRGAPELKADSKYNKDVEYISKNYNTTSDQFAVIVKVKSGGCIEYGNVVEQDRLTQYLLQVPGVVGVAASPTPLRIYISGMFEGYPKWMSLSRNVSLISGAMQAELVSRPELTNADCGIQPTIAYLTDHKAETLTRLVTAVERYSADHNTSERSFSLAAGSAGIEAVTNIVVADANRTMLLLLYASVTILCFITFRSWRAVVVALVPLIITSILCEALMVWLEIGVKVATLPAIALGVGIGVDYALYLLSVQLAEQRAGATLKEAYLSSIMFTGKMVALIGMTLAAGVFTWVFSPIKFQADMGILLTFMFIWNMLGALVLIPALSYFLLNKVGLTQRASVQGDLAIVPTEEDSEVVEKSSLQTGWDAKNPGSPDFGPGWLKRGFTKMNI